MIRNRTKIRISVNVVFFVVTIKVIHIKIMSIMANNLVSNVNKVLYHYFKIYEN